MKASIKQVLQAYQAIPALGQLPFKLAWRVNKLARALEPHAQAYAQDELLLLKQYGEEKPVGSGDYEIPPGKKAEFFAAQADRQADQVELDLQPLELALFDFAPDPKYPQARFVIQPATLRALDWLILEPQEEAPA